MGEEEELGMGNNMGGLNVNSLGISNTSNGNVGPVENPAVLRSEIEISKVTLIPSPLSSSVSTSQGPSPVTSSCPSSNSVDIIPGPPSMQPPPCPPPLMD